MAELSAISMECSNIAVAKQEELDEASGALRELKVCNFFVYAIY